MVRSPVETIMLVPGGGRLRITAQVKLVAGAGFEPAAFRL
jgi:hypothetical protein